MGRYYLTTKTYNRFKDLGYDLKCKICLDRAERGEIPLTAADIKPFDEVEAKAKASIKGPIFYHKECYVNSHYDENERDKYIRSEEEQKIFERDVIPELEKIIKNDKPKKPKKPKRFIEMVDLKDVKRKE